MHIRFCQRKVFRELLLENTRLVHVCLFFFTSSCAPVTTASLFLSDFKTCKWECLSFGCFYCECTAKLLHLYACGCGVCFVSERAGEYARVCVRGVKLKPLSPADGQSEDSLTQEQWGPLTKTTPPRHVASCHRGNPPWDRERADSWRGGLTKMESISFH